MYKSGLTPLENRKSLISYYLVLIEDRLVAIYIENLSNELFLVFPSNSKGTIIPLGILQCYCLWSL